MVSKLKFFTFFALTGLGMMLMLSCNEYRPDLPVVSNESEITQGNESLPQVTATLSQSNPTSLPDFSDTYAIEVIDHWDGLAFVRPINSHFALESNKAEVEGNSFNGNATFSVGVQINAEGQRSSLEQETVPITIPNEVVHLFLQKLAETQPEKGKYEPFFEWTDDYPQITIRLLYGEAETIEFYTSSQGIEHVPWQLTYNGHFYVVNSGVPMQALELLYPYFEQDLLEDLIEKASPD